MRKALFTRVTIALSVLSAALVLSALFTPFASSADEMIAGFLRANDHSLAVSGGMYNSSLPTLTSGTYANVAVDINGRVILSPSSSISATLALPFAGGAVGVATAANQSLGMQALNTTTGLMDPVSMNGSDQILTSDVLQPGPNSGANVIGTVLLSPSNRITVSGNNPSGAFGTTVCATPPCTKQVVTGAGILTNIVWNSLTAMSGFTLTCWDGTSAGTIDNELIQVQVMSAGGIEPINGQGWKFTIGLFCQTSAAITTSQAFNFWTHS